MTESEFWAERLNKAKFILAPMVDQSELPWRLLSRQYGAQLCYTPMINASLFVKDPTYRKENFTTCPQDRPLIVQFCCDNPEVFLEAAKLVEDKCDAVDLNLGCPQGIAKRGHYGCFLQDEWDLIRNIIHTASSNLKIPVTAKIRIFDDFDKTIAYAKMLEKSGTSLLAVHGRTRDQKGTQMGFANWKYIRSIKENLTIPVYANGNILSNEDVYNCLNDTKCDGVMIAESNLHNPAIFANETPAIWKICREYLQLVEKYECSLPIVRGHIFKICHNVFEVHNIERDLLAKSKTISEIYKLIDQIEIKCLESKQVRLIETNGRRYFYWQCQPFKRNFVAKIKNEGEMPNKRELEESIESIKKQDLRKRRKTEKAKRKEIQKKTLNNKKAKKYELCEYCQNPRSNGCVIYACRNCCKQNVFFEKKHCYGIWFYKNILYLD